MRLGLIQTDIEKINQIVDRLRGKCLDILDALFSKGLGLVGVDALESRDRNGLAGRHHLAHLLSDLLLEQLLR